MERGHQDQTIHENQRAGATRDDERREIVNCGKYDRHNRHEDNGGGVSLSTDTGRGVVLSPVGHVNPL
jgi:hypothetical protein